MTNANTDIRKLTEQEAANTAGGVEGYNYGNGWRTVMNLQGGYLAIRTAPSFKYENEIIHNGPRNGQLVQIVGEYVVMRMQLSSGNGFTSGNSIIN